MKDHKKSILVFCLFWIVGILGGYYLGVGSGVLPEKDLNYNLILSSNTNDSGVQPVTLNDEQELEESDRQNEKDYFIILRQLEIDKIPALLVHSLRGK